MTKAKKWPHEVNYLRLTAIEEGEEALEWLEDARERIAHAEIAVGLNSIFSAERKILKYINALKAAGNLKAAEKEES